MTSEEFIRYSFEKSATEFCIDICATARTGNDLSLFIPELLLDVASKGVGGYVEYPEVKINAQ